MIKIDDEFKDLIPPLSLEESKQLVKNILEDGIREPIILWRNTIIDGHNRYRIAQEYDLDYETTTLDFDSRSDVKLWMINNQLGRRNLAPYVRTKLALAYEEIVSSVNIGGRPKKGEENSPHVSRAEQTREKVAKIADVSDNTVQRVKKIEAKASDEDKLALKKGQKSINEVYTAIRNQEKAIEKHEFIKKIQKERVNTQKEKAIIYNEDCQLFLDRFEDKSVDLLLTDPPYSTDIADMDGFLHKWLDKALNKVKDTGRAFICIGAYPEEVFTYYNRLLYRDDWIVDNPLIWTYRNTLGVTPKMKYNLNYQMILHLYKETSAPLDNSITNEMFSVQDINAPDGRLGDRYHTWQKPAELGKRLVHHTTKEGDLVIDPFACTGTFILEAARAGRKAEGCDIDTNAIKIAYERGVEKG